MSDIIYCFTGTGNSLEAAEYIAGVLGHANIYPMKSENGLALKEHKFDRVGFVFPVYFGGLPEQVAGFLSNLDLGINRDSYLFVIGTYGGIPANAIRQAGALMEEKGASVNYGRFIRMPDNYILMYDSGKDHSKVQRRYSERIPGIAREIADRVLRPAKGSIGVVARYNRWNLAKLPAKAMRYHATDTCAGCGVCRDVCPANNIALEGDGPRFGGNCQSCVACIQYCPQQALNYGDKTGSRGRYRNPKYSARDLIEFQHRAWTAVSQEGASCIDSDN